MRLERFLWVHKLTSMVPVAVVVLCSRCLPAASGKAGKRLPQLYPPLAASCQLQDATQAAGFESLPRHR